MNNSNESDETKHLGEPEEVAGRWEKITKIFETASALTGKEREKFLKKSCGNDAEMRNEVEKLLKSFEDSESFMQNPAVAEAVSMFEEKKTLIGKNITGNVERGSFVAGTVLASRYRIIGMIGKGGMGEVYKAEDIKLSQTVALKFLPDNFQKDSAALERFHAEVRNARQVSHVNVCRVFDIGEIDGKHFLSMEFIDGDDLSSLLRRVGRLSSERAIEIARQLCVGLSAIHNAGILHRDFKPANVIIDSKGKARITDFGIAGVEAEIAKDNLRVGTPAYMSPEQITGKDVSAKSDIYALGLVLYEIFTGKQAVEADSIPELIRKQTSETPTNVSEFVKGIDPLVESVISQCIQKNPNDRPASALHVAMALPGGNPLQIALDAGQTPTPEMIAAAPKKGALKPVVALLCLLGLIAALIFGVYGHGFYKAYSFTPLKKTPDALAERAGTMIKNFGISESAADTKYEIKKNGAFLSYARKNQIRDSRERMRTGQPFAIYFLYRQSPELLKPRSIYSQGIEQFDPPLDLSGMVNVRLDTTGRLVEFRTVPSQKSEIKTDFQKTDWTKFFAEAGLDQTKFEKTAPEWTPPAFADEQFAWKGTMADFEDIPIRIEAASIQGKPIMFRIVPPWEKPLDTVSSPQSPRFLDWFWVLYNLLTLIIPAILVWINIRAGRADLKGTAKLTFASFLLLFLFWIAVSVHYLDPRAEFNLITDRLMISLFNAAKIGLAYCALEPYVRRWWSEILISWSRVLVGDFRDPMVGRDILIGGLIGVVSYGTAFFAVLANERLFGIVREVNTEYPFVYTSLPQLILSIFGNNMVANANRALGLLVLLVFFFFIFRRRWVAIICVGIVSGLPLLVGGNVYALLFLGVFVFGVVLPLTLIRFGLVAMISWMFFGGIFFYFPLSFDPGSILFSNTLVVLGILFAIAGYAAYISIGGAKMFGEKSWLGD